MWKAVRRMGFSEGACWSPDAARACSSPSCRKRSPTIKTLRRRNRSRHGRIAKQLFPNAKSARGFHQGPRRRDFELVIGNPPFSARRARQRCGRSQPFAARYFIARSIERLHPGGLAAFVTSRWTMDKIDATARTFIGTMADSSARSGFPKAQCTRPPEPTSSSTCDPPAARSGGAREGAELDRARRTPAQDGEEASRSIDISSPIPRWSWLHARPPAPMDRPTPASPPATNWTALFRACSSGLHSRRRLYGPSSGEARAETLDDETIRVGTAAEGATIKESSTSSSRTGWRRSSTAGRRGSIRNGKGTEGIPAKHARIIRGLIQIRDAVREVLRAQEADLPWGGAQVRLRGLHAHFKREFGPINLTTISETTGPTARSARPCAARTFSPSSTIPTSGSSPRSRTTTSRPASRNRARSSPSACSIRRSRRRSRARPMRSRSRCTRPAWSTRPRRRASRRHARGGDRGAREPHILDPQAGRSGFEAWRTADAYLSGPVRKKLEIAIDAATEDPRYQRNVEALKAALPGLKPSDIPPGSARLDPDRRRRGFVDEVLGVKTASITRSRSPHGPSSSTPSSRNPAATTEWGTARRDAGELCRTCSIPPYRRSTIRSSWTAREARPQRAETEAAKESSPRSSRLSRPGSGPTRTCTTS